jgi:hypothetical protein
MTTRTNVRQGLQHMGHDRLLIPGTIPHLEFPHVGSPTDHDFVTSVARRDDFVSLFFRPIILTHLIIAVFLNLLKLKDQ